MGVCELADLRIPKRSQCRNSSARNRTANSSERFELHARVPVSKTLGPNPVPKEDLEAGSWMHECGRRWSGARIYIS